MNCKHIFSTVLLASQAFVGCVFDDAPLGEKTLLVLTDSIVFVGGEYLPPPNVVSRKEGSIIIDGRVAETPVLWPPPKPAKVVVIKTPPEIPASITEATTMYDADFITHVSDMWNYLRNKFGFEDGADLMAEAYMKLPNVVSATRDKERGIIVLKFADGDEVNALYSSYDRRTAAQPTRGEAIKILEMYKRRHAEFPGMSQYYVRRSNKPRIRRWIVSSWENFHFCQDGIRVHIRHA